MFKENLNLFYGKNLLKIIYFAAHHYSCPWLIHYRYSSSFCQSDSAYESSPSSSKPISTSSTSSTIVPPSINSTESDGGVISRQESLRHSKSSKVERKVSFSGADPVVLESSPQKPKRIKEKSERKKKTDTSKHCDDLFDQVYFCFK